MEIRNTICEQEGKTVNEIKTIGLDRSCPGWTRCPAPSTSRVPVQSAESFRNEAGGEALP